MPMYKIATDGAEETFQATNLTSARGAAEEWLLDADWGLTSEDETIWPHCYLYEQAGTDEDGEVEWDPYGERIRARVDPPEPPCSDRSVEHDWQAPHEIVGGCESNPGVFGHGGGVRCHEACMRCGAERVTDTWATDKATGEQGLCSVTYRPGKYAEEVAALRAPIDVDLYALPGPLVEYGEDDSTEAVLAECPEGWAVDFSSQVKIVNGRYRAPLVEA